MSRARPTKKDYGARLMVLRETLGLTQRQMAEELRVTHGAIGLWERGERPVAGPVTKLIDIYEERLNRGELGRVGKR